MSWRFAGLVLFAVSVSTSSAAAQSGRISGTVSDSGSGRPLDGAVVAVVGTRLRASSDVDGRFTVVGVPAGAHTLQVRRIGYRVNTVAVQVADGATATADVRLVSAPLTLEAVVTTGMVDPTSGTRAPFAVGRIDAANAPVPATNAIETIQGKVAGVTVVAGGQAGSAPSIVLRTPTSINKSNAPLLVVDGVRGDVRPSSPLPAYHVPTLVTDLLTDGAFCDRNACPHRGSIAVRPLRTNLLVFNREGTTVAECMTGSRPGCAEARRFADSAKLALYRLVGMH